MKSKVAHKLILYIGEDTIEVLSLSFTFLVQFSLTELLLLYCKPKIATTVRK